MATLHKGDVGTVITAALSENVSTSTVRQIKYKKPGGTTGNWSAALGGDNESITYTTQADDLDVVGEWSFQAYVETPSWSGHGLMVTARVHDSL